MKKSTKEIIEELSSGPVQQYVLEHENHDIRDLILKHREILGIPTARLLEQIATRRKAKDKLPLYYQTPGIIFPPPENFEQSSSQSTAMFKSLIIKGLLSERKGTGADLTGGFGADTYFLSTALQSVHYVEPQTFLLEIARHNHVLLGAHNIEYHSVMAEDFLRTFNTQLDVIYADPSRRNDENKRINTLEEASPDLLKLKAQIFEKTRFMLVKASPLLDIQTGIKQLSFVRRVFVVSVNNECKEVLFLCEKDFSGEPAIEATNILEGQHSQTFEFSFPEERQQAITFSDPLEYLYEPNASILKAGAFKSIAVRFGVKKIQANTHLYTADHLVEEFPGRRFKVEKHVRPDPSELKKIFPDGKANVTTRNYPLTPEGLKKKTRLRDGGEKFLIGFSGQQKKFLVVAKRV